MSDDDRLTEILARLDALEERMDALERDGAAPCGFLQEEKRIVDTLVRLTAERIERAMDERMERQGPPDHRGPPDHHRGPPPPPPRHGPPPGHERGGRR